MITEPSLRRVRDPGRVIARRAPAVAKAPSRVPGVNRGPGRARGINESVPLQKASPPRAAGTDIIHTW